MGLVVFALRILLGGLLVAAGVLKALDGPAAGASLVAGYRMVPAPLVAPVGVALPYLEIFLGAYLVLGLFTRPVASVVTLQFGVFAVAVASLVVRHIPANCGCFGSSIPTPPSWAHVAADLALAAVAGAIAGFAPGRYALDRTLWSGGSAAAFRETEIT